MEHFVFGIETFEPTDGLDVLKILEEAAELEVAFKIWGGQIKDSTYSNDFYHQKNVYQTNVENELADVVIACVNFAKKHRLSIEAGIARKNEVNLVRGYAKRHDAAFLDNEESFVPYIENGKVCMGGKPLDLTEEQEKALLGSLDFTLSDVVHSANESAFDKMKNDTC